MSNNALYFPYINVPQSTWFIQVLLYWDKAYSIVPNEYFHHPERLDPFMRELVAAELVEQIVPEGFIDKIPNFGRPFITYVHRRLSQIERRRLSSPVNLQPKALLHIEKVARVADELRELNLARHHKGPWYKVEAWVADAFMAYLASSLGVLDEINAAPVTGHADSFQVLGGNLPNRNQVRELILENIFPTPDEIDINKLVEFKAKHRKLLHRLRDKIEGDCIELANITSITARRERSEILVREIKEEINEITSFIKNNWQRVTFRTLIPLLGVGAGAIAAGPLEQPIVGAIASGSSLTTAVYEAVGGIKHFQQVTSKPLAYAAFARSTFKEI